VSRHEKPDDERYVPEALVLSNPVKVLLAGAKRPAASDDPQIPQTPVLNNPAKVYLAAGAAGAAAEASACPGGSAISSVPKKVNLMHLMRAPLWTLVIVALSSHTLLTSPLWC
jgi:hypothetical protein